MTPLDPLRGTPAWGAGDEVPDLAALVPPRFSQPALCAEADPDEWFPNQAGSPNRAKRICRGCPAREECLAWALTHDEYGVWGGTTRKQRQRMQADQAKPKRTTAAVHGTSSGYRRHRYDREPPCEQCRAAEAEYQRARRAAKRGVAA